MWTFLLVVFSAGPPAILQAAPVQGVSGRCSFAGVFHVEGSSRASLSFQQALDSCQSLGFTLATQEQVTKAYTKGLQTCRHGWIDGQNVMFLPQTEGPKCDSGSAEVSIHAEPAEYLSDVYCFNPADSSTTCEEDPQSIMNTNTATENGKPHGDILSEAKSEGFLVDFEEILGNIQKDASPPSDLEVTNVEDVKTVEETSTLTKNKDTHHPRDVSSSPSSPFLWFDQEGSGIQSPFTTSPITKEPIEFVNLQDNFFEPGLSEVPVRRTSNKGLRLLQPFLTPPPSASLKEGSPSTWMIITAFCVIVGAIVCILVAIGTRDMWYGPRKSRNITTQENDKDYSKTATIPLSEKEQEIVALMNVTNLKNGKMADVTGVDENEKEYLM